MNFSNQVFTAGKRNANVNVGLLVFNDTFNANNISCRVRQEINPITYAL